MGVEGEAGHDVAVCVKTAQDAGQIPGSRVA